MFTRVLALSVARARADGHDSAVVLLGVEAHGARRHRMATLLLFSAIAAHARLHAPLKPMLGCVTQVALAMLAALSVVFFLFGPMLSRLTRLPIITIYLAAGLLCQLFISPGVHKPLHDYLQPMHNAALGCITLAAGGELVLEQLRANARAIGCITFSLSVWSLLLVFPLTLSSLMRWELLGTGSRAGTGKKAPGHDTRAWATVAIGPTAIEYGVPLTCVLSQMRLPSPQA